MGVRLNNGTSGVGMSSAKRARGEAGEISGGCLGLLLLLGLLVTLGQCMSGGDEPSRSPVQGLVSAPADGVTSIDADEAGKGVGDIVYVQSSALNARAGPSTDAAVVEKLPQGAALQVVERSGDWTKVAQGAATYWIASRHVGAIRPARQSFAAPAPARPKPRKRTPESGYSGNCGCGGGNVCIGPRGGRYCITSGGRKRYGV